MKGIWIKHEGLNHYAEFLKSFDIKSGKCEIKISVDTEYALYLNGKYVAHGQYADFPFYKSYDLLDLTPYVKEGKNLLAIRAYHAGRSFFVHYHTAPALAFEVYEDGKLIAESDVDTLGRLSHTYANGDREVISSQLGYNFAYDFTKEDDWINGAIDGFEPVKSVETEWTLVPRPIEKCILADPIIPTLSTWGNVQFDGGKTNAEIAQRAYFQPRLVNQAHFDYVGEKKIYNLKASENSEGLYAIFDLAEETAGYLIINVDVEEECDLILSYGEHLVDGRVRSFISGRNFAFTLHLKKGNNKLEHYFRRLGCRYLQIVTNTKNITVSDCTLREWQYPFVHKNKHFKDSLIEKLYAVGERTLRTCFHEHYEDCPWREQALYGMDSRNQMLFGYGVFGEYSAPRASLRLLAYSAKESGLLTITAPTNETKRIPSFSLYWIIALTENASVDYDEEFVEEMLPYAERIVSIFTELKTDKGLTSLRGVDNWNFYEWSSGLSGNSNCRGDDNPKPNDLLLTSLFIYALRALANLERKAGKVSKSEEYFTLADELSRSFECFYNEEKGAYATFLSNGEKTGYHKHTQSLVILAGGIPKEREIALAKALMADNTGLVEQTFASMAFKYDAIIKATGNKEFVFEDAKKRFGAMIFNGATTFWETELGEIDFNHAGSLCHAWSAIPCYLVDKYGWGL